MEGTGIDLRWRKSSFSANGGGDCVEVGHDAGAVAVRDTKDRRGSVLRFDADAWRRFAEQVKRSLTCAGYLGSPIRWEVSARRAAMVRAGRCRGGGVVLVAASVA